MGADATPLADPDVTRPDKDIAKGHLLLQERVPVLEQELLDKYGWATKRIEVYRPELRQQWLYGAGRTVPELAIHGISPAYARPHAARVTNAWSAKVSAHGWTMGIHPAAAALDIVPLGKDGLPWTQDDPWDAFVATMAKIGPRIGLVHFHSPGKVPWDRPHLELIEWDNATHRLIV